jgi:hypothetical protein
MTRSRPLRAGAVAVVCALTLVGACGSSDRDEADVAKEDRAVVQHNKEVAEFEAKVKAALREKWQKRAKALRAQALARARARAAARGPQRLVVRKPGGGFVSVVGDICAPIRLRSPGEAGRAERRARLQRRKQALDYLNLRCPT